jgi:hypothetical protein
MSSCNKQFKPNEDGTIVEKESKNSTIRYIVIDNFYDDPLSVRDFALKQEYTHNNYLPRYHTKCFATNQHRDYFENIVKPFSGKIINFEFGQFNGSFQYSTSFVVPWIHCDCTDWAAIIYLTPDAHEAYGTSFYSFKDGSISKRGSDETINIYTDKYKYDITKWDLTDSIGNLFNRLVIYNSKYYHKPSDYFGTNLENARLFQMFFFDTEIHN